MKNIFKLFLIPFLILILFIGTTMNVKAYISSESDIQYKIDQLKKLRNFDFFSLINKNQLIGYRLEGFNMSSGFYINSVIVVSDNLNNILKQIEFINNSTDYSDTEKNMQINKLYQNANTVLNDLDMKTMNFLIEIREYMPTVSYQKFVKSFKEYYNSLELSGSNIDVY